MSEQRCSALGPVLIIGVICVLSILFVVPPLLARAAQPDPPIRPPTATPDYPDRPATATPAFPPRPPTATPPPSLRPSRPSAEGAEIELNVRFLPRSPASVQWREDLWTMVEWQDGQGNWHDVEGWKAILDEVKGSEGRKVWYVSSDLFGKGPFCWVICPDPGSEPIATSAPFHMPDAAGETVRVNVSVGQRVAVTPLPTVAVATLPVAGGDWYLRLWLSLTVALIGLLLASALSTGSSRRLE